MSQGTPELYRLLSPEDRRVVDIMIYTLLAKKTIQEQAIQREPEIGFNALLIALAKARGEGR